MLGATTTLMIDRIRSATLLLISAGVLATNYMSRLWGHDENVFLIILINLPFLMFFVIAIFCQQRRSIITTFIGSSFAIILGLYGYYDALWKSRGYHEIPPCYVGIPASQGLIAAVLLATVFIGFIAKKIDKKGAT